MTSKRIDFDRIRADHPLPDIVRASGVEIIAEGAEYRALCPFHSERTPSFSIYRNKDGDWKCYCFGCGAGGDVIQYVQDFYRLDNAGDAARYLNGEQIDARPISPSPTPARDPYAGYEIVTPVPAHAPPIIAGKRTPSILNPKRDGKLVTYDPTMVFPYRSRNGDLLGYVIRVEFDGRKITPGVWWTRNAKTGFEGWAHGRFPEPRPLYGLPELYSNADRQVLVVEGEKCRNAAQRIIASLGLKMVSVTWMGGGEAVSKSDWRALKGRSVLIWPDAGISGWGAGLDVSDAAMDAGVARVKMIRPAGKPDGWDIADAEQDGTDIRAFIKSNIVEWSRETNDAERSAHDAAKRERREAERRPISDANARPDRADPPAVENLPAVTPAKADRRLTGLYKQNWQNDLIMNADGEGLSSSSTQNAYLILVYNDKFRNTMAWNEFDSHAYVMKRPEWAPDEECDYPRRMTDSDVIGARRMLEYYNVKMKASDMGAIMNEVARHHRYNEVVGRLSDLVWDGIPRIQGGMWEGDSIAPWLSEYCGVANTEINRLFGMKWMISAVARAMKPGCKVDTMLIVEGGQGQRKSTAFKVLCDAIDHGLFTDDAGDIGSKDAVIQIQGKWIVEMSEMTGATKVDVRKMKEFMSRPVDRIRRPYGKTSEDLPRTCVYVGTVNPGGTGYMRDSTGARRFWPVKVDHEIDIARLAADAPQLWAEAVKLYRDGMKWWLTHEEEKLAEIVQRERYQEDPWQMLIDDFVRMKSEVNLMEIMQMLEIPKERRDHRVNTRIADHLHHMGWARVTDDRGTYYVRGN